MKTQTTESQVNKTAVAFYRVSTDRQQNDRQIEDVQRYCKAYGYQLIKEFQEIISGASKLSDRKELKEMLKYVDENQPDFVICSELSRLARSQDSLQIIENWTRQGVTFISLKEGIRTLDENKKTNPMTQLLLGILQAINIFELETIKYRTVSGLNKSAAGGTWIGGTVPYGYNLIEKRLVINEDEAQTVNEIFQYYLKGWGSNKIASHLNRSGKTTKEGKIWREQTIHKMLTNTLFAGRRLYKGEEMQTPETRIIDDLTFVPVQEKIKNKKSQPKLDKHQQHEYLLQGKIKCSCGSTFSGRHRDNAYFCKSQKFASGCGVRSVKMSWVDEQVKQKLFINYSSLLGDKKQIIDNTLSLKAELSDVTDKIAKEKTHQNYLINSIARIGEQKFNEKFDASQEYLKTLEAREDEINIKLRASQQFRNLMAPKGFKVTNPLNTVPVVLQATLT